MRIKYTGQQIWHYLILGVIYSLAHHGAWMLSTGWDILPNTVSWYLPAGVRVAFFLFTPLKCWPIVYLVFKASQMLLLSPGQMVPNDYQLSITSHYLFQLVYIPLLTIFSWLFYWWFKRTFRRPYLHTLSSAASLFILAILMSLLSVSGFLLRKVMEGAADWQLVIDVVPAFIAGDMAGVALIAPLVVVVRELIKRPTPNDRKMLFELCSLWLGTLTIGYWLSSLSTELEYGLKGFCLLLLLLLSFRYTWKGAAISVFFICLFTYITALSSTLPMLEQQFYLLVVMLIGLLVGASRHEQLKHMAALNRTNAHLIETNNELQASLSTLNTLTHYKAQAFRLETDKVVGKLQQEMAAELENINTRLQPLRGPRSRILSSTVDMLSLQLTEEFASYTQQANSTTQLADLIESQLANSLQQSGVTLHMDIKQQVPAAYNLPLYRITQEALSNVIRHSRATEVTISLTQEPACWQFSIRDNGQGFPTSDTRDGFGLHTMQERVETLGGTLLLVPSSLGTTVCVKLPIKVEGGQDVQP